MSASAHSAAQVTPEAPAVGDLDGLSRDWREFATDAENAELERFARRAQRLDAARQRLSREVRLIRDRCCQRRRHAHNNALAAAARALGLVP